MDEVAASLVDDLSVVTMKDGLGEVAGVFHGLALDPLVLPPLEANSNEGDEGAEEFAGEFDTRVGAGH